MIISHLAPSANSEGLLSGRMIEHYECNGKNSKCKVSCLHLTCFILVILFRLSQILIILVFSLIFSCFLQSASLSGVFNWCMAIRKPLLHSFGLDYHWRWTRSDLFWELNVLVDWGCNNLDFLLLYIAHLALNLRIQLLQSNQLLLICRLSNWFLLF